MAKQKADSNSKTTTTMRHPLLLYQNLGRRYRPPGCLLFFMGLAMFLPLFISDLESDTVDSESFAIMGAVVVLVGLAFWLFSLLAVRRSYVQCRPDVFEIHTPFYRVLISYRRMVKLQSVQVSTLFPREQLKGMGKALMLPLQNKTAVEMVVSSWPKGRLKRFLPRYLFSPREQAWVFIVPNHNVLMNQIDAARQNKQTDDKGSYYLDPFERFQMGKRR